MAQLLYACLLLLLLVPATRASCGSLIPEPCELSCEGCELGDFVADPEDCTRYYYCQGGDEDSYYPEPVPCGTGEYFNTLTHQCSASATCTICPDVRSCAYECPNDGSEGVIANRYYCNLYYECKNGETTTIQCSHPTDVYFDGKKCQDDETQCCHCHPYCTLAHVQNDNEKVLDPKDCRLYYPCFEVGTPTVAIPCEDGKYFDESSQDCLSDIPCYKPCINVVGGDGCIDPFTCINSGYFARCPDQCTPDYYHCLDADIGDFIEAQTCSSGVFHPTSHTCVTEDKCP